MKSILKLVISCLCFVEIIDSKMVRLQPNDEIYSYTIDPTVLPLWENVNYENISFEQIDDENVEISGYGVFLKSMDPNMLMQIDIKTKHFQNSVWQDAPFRVTLPNVCPELLNPSRFWYNLTKLWTNCPPQKGDKWEIGHQMLEFKLILPPSVPTGSWRGYILCYQFGMKSFKLGMMLQVEVTEIV